MPGQAKRILILGHGAMGQAFEGLLGPRHAITVWDRDLDTGVETQPLEEAARGQDVVLFALPTNPHDELAGRLAPCLDADTICLSIAKGLDEHGRTPAQIFDQHLGTRQGWALLYGPMLARELQSGRAGFALAATRQPSVAAALRVLFDGTALYLEHGDDILGAAWAAILKNVYVPLIGAVDALGLGDNMRGFLIAEATRELAAILQHLGARPETAYTCAGLGDLTTSATSASSHHRRIGAELTTGQTGQLAASGVNIRSEGVHTLAMVRAHGLFEQDRFALFGLVCRFLDHPAGLEADLRGYLDRRFEH